MTPSTTSLTSLEVASGLVFGRVQDELPQAAGSPREALERTVLPALRRPPCVVSFSGGRDSSAVLAVAAAVARREGLPLPIPVTNRFPGAPSSREDEWQERVVRHLGLEDWLRLVHDDELDVIGPYARRVLSAHGILWPFNAHFHAPIVERAAGGSLLTGIGGDELLGESSWARQLDLIRLRVRPVRRDLRRLVHFAAPALVRRRRIERRLPVAYGWLTPAARRDVARAWARQLASEPRRPAAHVRWRGSFRYHGVGAGSLALLASSAGVEAIHPFLARGFRAALVAEQRGRPLRTRTAAMQALFGDLLPEDVLARETKSFFDEAFFARPSRDVAASWDGRGVDPAVVDAEALAAEWSSERPDARSYLLLQAVWLGGRSAHDRVEEQPGGGLERAPLVRSA